MLNKNFEIYSEGNENLEYSPNVSTTWYHLSPNKFDHFERKPANFGKDFDVTYLTSNPLVAATYMQLLYTAKKMDRPYKEKGYLYEVELTTQLSSQDLSIHIGDTNKKVSLKRPINLYEGIFDSLRAEYAFSSIESLVNSLKMSLTELNKHIYSLRNGQSILTVNTNEFNKYFKIKNVFELKNDFEYSPETFGYRLNFLLPHALKFRTKDTNTIEIPSLNYIYAKGKVDLNQDIKFSITHLFPKLLELSRGNPLPLAIGIYGSEKAVMKYSEFKELCEKKDVLTATHREIKENIMQQLRAEGYKEKTKKQSGVFYAKLDEKLKENDEWVKTIERINKIEDIELKFTFEQLESIILDGILNADLKNKDRFSVVSFAEFNKEYPWVIKDSRHPKELKNILIYS